VKLPRDAIGYCSGQISRWFAERQRCKRVKSDLGDSRYTVHLRCSTLKEAYECKRFGWTKKCWDSSEKGLLRLTMPMNGRIDRQFVGHEYLNVVPFINFDQRAGLLVIN